jgi:hypothetical protein
LFVKDFGINVCTFVWDRFLFEGEVAVYRSCLAAFWCLRDHLLGEGLQGAAAILQDPSKIVTTANFETAYSRFVALDYHVLSQALHQVLHLHSFHLSRAAAGFQNVRCPLPHAATGFKRSQRHVSAGLSLNKNKAAFQNDVDWPCFAETRGALFSISAFQ